jgi:hypothetical protein
MILEIISGIMTLFAFLLAGLLIWGVIQTNKNDKKIRNDLRSVITEDNTKDNDTVDCILNEMGKLDNEVIQGILYTACQVDPDPSSQSKRPATCKNYDLKTKFGDIKKTCKISDGTAPFSKN